MKKQKVIDFLITFVIYFLVFSWLHELGHIMGGKIVGVEYSAIWEGWAFFAVPVSPSASHPLVYLSGGLFASIVAALLWWRARVSPTLWDIDDEIVLALIAAIEIALGLAEWVAYEFNLDVFLAEAVASLVACIPIAIYYIPKFLDWVGAEHRKEARNAQA